MLLNCRWMEPSAERRTLNEKHSIRLMRLALASCNSPEKQYHHEFISRVAQRPARSGWAMTKRRWLASVLAAAAPSMRAETEHDLIACR